MTTTESPTIPKPRLPLAVRAGLTVVAMFAAVGAAMPVGTLLRGGPRWLFLLGAGVASTVVAAIVIGVLTRFVDRRRLYRLGVAVGKRTPFVFLAGLVAVAAPVVVTALVASATGQTTSSSQPFPSLVMVLALAFLMQAVPEELLFRGYLFQTSAASLPAWGVVVLSSGLFGALHILSQSGATSFSQKLLYVVMATGLGALATAMRIAGGSVWAAVGVHGGFHLTNYAVASWWVQPLPGAFVAYYSTLTVALFSATAAVLFWAAKTGRFSPRGRLLS